MPAISPTTWLVSGSMSMTLSPAAFVWTIRTVAACSDRASGRTRVRATTKDLVFIATHFKLRSHVADPLFHDVGPDRAGGSGRLGAQLRRVQGEDRAASARETARSRTLRRVPFDRHELPPAAALAGPEDVDRRTVAEELP